MVESTMESTCHTSYLQSEKLSYVRANREDELDDRQFPIVTIILLNSEGKMNYCSLALNVLE